MESEDNNIDFNNLVTNIDDNIETKYLDDNVETNNTIIKLYYLKGKVIKRIYNNEMNTYSVIVDNQNEFEQVEIINKPISISGIFYLEENNNLQNKLKKNTDVIVECFWKINIDTKIGHSYYNNNKIISLL